MPHKDVAQRREYMKRYYAARREDVLKQQHERRRLDPESVSRVQKHWQLRAKYGITLEEYQRMSERQNGRCAICGGPEIAGKQLAVDHDHVTGRIRGLLCQNCNRALGMFKDNPVVLQSAIRYLFRARFV